MKFDVIHADPAWTFQTYGKTTDRHADHKYSIMTLEDMCNLPVKNLAKDNAMLFMWATYPNLLEAFELGKAWGFEYKTCAFTWVKRTTTNKHWNIGMGYYTRANAEPCLLFTRGKPKRISKGVQQIIDTRYDQPELFDALIAPISAHSTKPIQTYERIEQLCAPSYLDLFSRSRRNGWTSLGNDIDGKDLRDTIPALAKSMEINYTRLGS